MKIIIIALFLVYNFQQVGIKKPNIGDKVDVSNLPVEHLIIGPSEIRECYRIEINGINYSIGIKKIDLIDYININKAGMIDYISTVDSNFTTSENVKIGDSYKQVKKLTENMIIVLRGWGYVNELSSGWKAVFTQGSTMTEGDLESNSKVKFFHKK